MAHFFDFRALSASWRFGFSILLWAACTQSAQAVDEIQVYNAGVAALGQFTIQKQLNHARSALNITLNLERSDISEKKQS
jgi:hypothetical protein